MDLGQFSNLQLSQGFRLVGIEIVEGPMLDAIGRPALAKAVIESNTIRIYLAAGQTPGEMSVSIYHEVLEAMTIGVPVPPPRVFNLTEAGFEQAAQDAYQRHGLANKVSVINFIHELGFGQ